MNTPLQPETITNHPLINIDLAGIDQRYPDIADEYPIPTHEGCYMDGDGDIWMLDHEGTAHLIADCPGPTIHGRDTMLTVQNPPREPGLPESYVPYTPLTWDDRHRTLR